MCLREALLIVLMRPSTCILVHCFHLDCVQKSSPAVQLCLRPYFTQKAHSFFWTLKHVENDQRLATGLALFPRQIESASAASLPATDSRPSFRISQRNDRRAVGHAPTHWRGLFCRDHRDGGRPRGCGRGQGSVLRTGATKGAGARCRAQSGRGGRQAEKGPHGRASCRGLFEMAGPQPQEREEREAGITASSTSTATPFMSGTTPITGAAGIIAIIGIMRPAP
jgi:hypothetical protein